MWGCSSARTTQPSSSGRSSGPCGSSRFLQFQLDCQLEVLNGNNGGRQADPIDEIGRRAGNLQGGTVGDVLSNRGQLRDVFPVELARADREDSCRVLAQVVNGGR